MHVANHCVEVQFIILLWLIIIKTKQGFIEICKILRLALLWEYAETATSSYVDIIVEKSILYKSRGI